MLLRLISGRRALQVVLLILAAIIVLHGLLGPQIAPRNLATVLTWVHYRGLLVLALLAAGNLFCASCPMILARDGARRLWHPAWRWPRRLRGKWLGILLLAAVLFTYELFDLWALPAATAWLIIGYFLAAIVVDTAFSGATFCKHLCPIGQFNFIASTMSPTELRASDTGVCRSCRTVDCIKGRHVQKDVPYANVPSATRRADPLEPATLASVPLATRRAGPFGPATLRGCELALFMPNKVGNIDCTLCGDCVRACPHDNIELAWRVPGAELLDGRRRSGIGTLVRRPDLAALAAVFTFAGLLNAFAMTAPALALSGGGLAMLFAAGLVIPIAVFTRPALVGYAYALVPVGLGVWLAHYSFHFLTGALTVVPVVQAAAIDATGTSLLGEPLWTMVGMQPGEVFPIQLGFLILGAAGSLGLAKALSGTWTRTVLPAVVVVAIAVAAVWTLTQPMAMRGVGSFG